MPLQGTWKGAIRAQLTHQCAALKLFPLPVREGEKLTNTIYLSLRHRTKTWSFQGLFVDVSIIKKKLKFCKADIYFIGVEAFQSEFADFWSLRKYWILKKMSPDDTGIQAQHERHTSSYSFVGMKMRRHCRHKTTHGPPKHKKNVPHGTIRHIIPLSPP